MKKKRTEKELGGGRKGFVVMDYKSAILYLRHVYTRWTEFNAIHPNMPTALEKVFERLGEEL